MKEIKNEVEKIRRKYLDSAEEIVSGYNRECELAKDYEGRQMFELLQNADDETEGSSGKVLITFDGKTLSVSNTGKPFSIKGIKSLLYPNASPKKIHANKIGCKGLGFRSILTWTNSVTVASKDFTIQFSKEYAKEFLKSILAEKPELNLDIKSISNEPYPIATLTCPKILNESSLVDGFSTSIIMECNDDLASTIEKQIVGLQFEELVFLPNLKEIEIICNDYHRVFHKIIEGDKVIIKNIDKNNNSIKNASWKLFKKNGIIKDENNKNKNYEFIIAYDPSGEYQGEVLYSYFKTDIKLGFPALIHGTFELTSDRNNLQKSSYVNKQLVPLLADFMVQTAVDISKEQKECDYRPLSLVVTSDIDNILEKEYQLDSFLRDKIREKKILPTISNIYISINDAPKYSDYKFDSVLDAKVFSNLLKCTDDYYIANFLKNDLDINFYDYNDFCQLLNNNIINYTLDQKVDIIELIKNEFKMYSTNIFPHLLIDNNGKCIEDDSKVYPLPHEEQVIDLPNWIDIRFLNKKMEKKISEKLGISTLRTLVSELSRYNLEEYSFEKLLRGVVNQVDEDITSVDKCSDILNWLWKYYNSEERQPIPDVKVKAICRDGKIRYAKETYIGSEYGNDLGERLVSVFSNNFVALNELKIEYDDISNLINFLEWLGVSKYPRLEEKTLLKEEYTDFIKTCYPLYVRSDDCSYSEKEFSHIRNIVVGFFENLDVLLNKANFNDLLAWFLLDENINCRLYSETEDKNEFSYISGLPYKKQDIRKVTPSYIKSYLRYYLSNIKWIPNLNGDKEKPSYCCFEDNSLEPFIVVPNVDYTYLKDIIGRNCKKDIEALLSCLGVSDYFQDMKNTVVYQTLIKLPELDTECKKAKPLYRKIIRDGATPEEYEEDNIYYNEFIENGWVLAKNNGKKKYVPVSEARYADKKEFSYEILKNFSMLDVDARSGEEKIRKLFGVKPLKYTNIEIDGVPELHPLNEIFKKEYFNFLPFVYACRIELKNANKDFGSLKRTNIILCSNIKIKCKIVDDYHTSCLNKYERVYLRKNNTAYICVPSNIKTFEELKSEFDFAESVAELITAILDVNEDKDFFRDLFRENELVREKKMRYDKGDDNLELLNAARKKFKMEIDLRDEFWRTIAEVLSISNSKELTTDELISKLQLKNNIDKDINFENLNCPDNIKNIISIFESLGIDIDTYNKVAFHTIDISTYWESKLKEKMEEYKLKYQAYLYDKLKNDKNCIELYDKYCDEYTFIEFDTLNSINVDINSVFENKFGVSFNVLDTYSDSLVASIIDVEKSKVTQDIWEKICKSYLPSQRDVYLLFGKIDELYKIDEKVQEEKNSEFSIEERRKKIIEEAFATSAEGFLDINTQSTKENFIQDETRRNRKHNKRVHSEAAEQKKQEIGFIGEAYVFKELSNLYPNARWISGNGEKAGCILKGDDTCGYDIKYTDENGTIQYVEVKTSTNEDISFSISDNELRFGYQNASCYEIIYVVIGDNGKPLHKPWRLGHLFEFENGEDIFHNNKFSIESESYSIVAKPILNDK